jgi:hypothetical protein
MLLGPFRYQAIFELLNDEIKCKTCRSTECKNFTNLFLDSIQYVLS